MDQLRASDADRERAADRLRHAGGDGRLTVDELGERVQLAFAARTRGELDDLLSDLGEPRSLPARPPASDGLVVRPGAGGAGWVVGILGEARRAGRWRVARRCVVVNLMGGADIDLNDAELAADEVELTVLSILGDSKVRVPEGLRVEVSDVGILGSNTVEHSAAGAGGHAGPVLRVRLVSVLGSASVRRGPRLTRRERRKLRRLKES